MRGQPGSLTHPLGWFPMIVLLLLAACGGTEQGDTEQGGAGPEPAAETPMAPTGTGEDASTGGVAASCIAAVVVGDRYYLQVPADRVVAGPSVPGAQVPPCDDTGDSEWPATPIDAFTIEGVAQQYAVVAEGAGGQVVYVADGYVPGLDGAKPLPGDVAAALGIG